MVKLKISQEISSQGADVSISGLSYPSITKRKAETVGIVQSGNTLIIGGLLSEEMKKDQEGIPILSKIPILGYLFGVTSVKTKKVELILLITPHIVNTTTDSDELKNRFGNRNHIRRYIARRCASS